MPVLEDNSFQVTPDTKRVGERGLYLWEDSWDGAKTLKATILFSRKIGYCLITQRFLPRTTQNHLQKDDGIHLFDSAEIGFQDQLEYEEWIIKNAEKQAQSGHWPSQQTIKKAQAEIDKILGLDWAEEEARAWKELDTIIRDGGESFLNIPVQQFPIGSKITDISGEIYIVGGAKIGRNSSKEPLVISYENDYGEKIQPVTQGV